MHWFKEQNAKNFLWENVMETLPLTMTLSFNLVFLTLLFWMLSEYIHSSGQQMNSFQIFQASLQFLNYIREAWHKGFLIKTYIEWRICHRTQSSLKTAWNASRNACIIDFWQTCMVNVVTPSAENHSMQILPLLTSARNLISRKCSHKKEISITKCRQRIKWAIRWT